MHEYIVTRTQMLEIAHVLFLYVCIFEQVYAKGIPGGNLPTAEEAKKYNWQVKWVAVRPSKGVEHPVGGFPCTASRLLKGKQP